MDRAPWWRGEAPGHAGTGCHRLTRLARLARGRAGRVAMAAVSSRASAVPQGPCVRASLMVCERAAAEAFLLELTGEDGQHCQSVSSSEDPAERFLCSRFSAASPINCSARTLSGSKTRRPRFCCGFWWRGHGSREENRTFMGLARQALEPHMRFRNGRIEAGCRDHRQLNWIK